MIRQKSVRVGDIIEACIPRESALSKGLLTARVSAAYRQAVGGPAAAATMKISYKDGILLCKISTSVYRMHLSGNKDEIMKAINGILGREEIKTLIFT